MKKVFSFISLWLPPLVWGLVIFAFSSRSVPPASQIFWQDFLVKKSAHVFEYAVFSTLLYRALRGNLFGRKNSGLFAILISLFYAMTDELHQFFTPGREPRVRDVVFDTIGASLAIYLIWNLLPTLPVRLKDLAKRLQIL